MKNAYYNSIVIAGLVLGLAWSTQVPAENRAAVELEPLQAHTVSVENYTAVVYFTIMANGHFLISTTMGPNVGFDGVMTQQQTIIKPGQAFSMTMDTGIHGEPATAVRFSAESDALVIASRQGQL